VLLLIAAAAARAAGDDPAWLLKSTAGMVAADHAEASRIGAAVLKSGGNAFDAAVATSLALTVCRPESTGIGGGGFMVAYVAGERRFVALDFRETAPASATPERYAALHAARGDGPSPSVFGGNAVAVPGLLAGLAELHRRYCTRPWAELVRPAIELAEHGFSVDTHFRDACEEAVRDYEKWPELNVRCRALDELLRPGGELLKVGDRLRRPELARALTLISQRGAEAFYQGEIGEAIVGAVNAAGGQMSPGDLRAYRVKEREPLREQYSGYEFVLMPPPSSGGVCIAEILNILSHTRYAAAREGDPGLAAHLMIESMKHALADRALLLGDPDAAPIPTARLTSRAYAATMAATISSDRTGEPEEYGAHSAPGDDGGTSHFCVADRAANIVAMTETINDVFGSRVVAPEFGIVLNNEMDDFLTVRGQANLFGLVQSERNLVGPGRRPLSSMAPTIVLKDGRPVLVIGASGGPRIISSVTQVTLRALQGESIADALSAVRLHHQWRPNEVNFDREPPTELSEALRRRGHALSSTRKTGHVQAIQFLDDGTMIGASDPRKGGRPAGAD
jgi:gamma-glutamyltranspeptidase/glutathione hydrolase